MSSFIWIYTACKLNYMNFHFWHFNPLCTGRLIQCYMLDKSICHIRGVGSILSLLFYLYFCWKILLANNGDPDQTPRYVASNLGLHCLSLTPFTGF